MSLLGGLLDVVGIVGAVMTGGALGFLAAGVLAVGAASQFGLIGGSVGKFMQSGAGQLLTAAVSLGAAYEGYQALQGTQDINSATNSVQSASNAANDSQAVATPTDASQAVGTTNSIAAASASTPDAAAANGVVGQQMVNGDLTNPAANAAGSSAAQTAGDTAAVQPAGQAGTAGAQTGAGPQAANAAVATDNPATGLPQGVNPSTSTSDIDAAAAKAPAGPTTGSSGGLLSWAQNNPKLAAGIAQGAGSVISGVGQGIAQNEAIEKQIAAQQWGNNQWNNAAEVQQLQSAAASPITVPQGYLQRAQALKGLMAGNTGIQPAPGAPVSPSPVPPAALPGAAAMYAPQAPPGQPTGSMQTPRGGVI